DRQGAVVEASGNVTLLCESLPEELHAHLADASAGAACTGLNAGHAAEGAAAVVSAGVAEVGVVHGVEELRPDQKRHALMNPGRLLHAHVKVHGPGPMEEAKGGVA